MSDSAPGDAVTPPAVATPAPRPEKSLLPLAVTLLLLAVLLTWADRAYRAQADRTALAAAIAESEAALAQTQPAQRQLNALATKTLRLAREGNENAAAVIEQMLAAGITLTPSQPAATEQ